MKKVIYSILLISWLVVIFIFSNQNGAISGGNSSEIIYSTLDIIYNLFNIPKDSLYEILELIHNPIRECAHVFEYFVLSFLTFKTLENYNIKENKYIITILFCFIASSLDEIHQLFIINRSFEYYDILMDMLGCILMILFIKIESKVKVGIKG